MHEGDNECMLRDCDIFGFMADDFLHFTQSTSTFGPAKSTETFSLFSNFQCENEFRFENECSKIPSFLNSQLIFSQSPLITSMLTFKGEYQKYEIPYLDAPGTSKVSSQRHCNPKKIEQNKPMNMQLSEGKIIE